MNYELAKQLKEAGFPQINDDFRTINEPTGKEEWAYSPTLSELIEACGDYLSIEECSDDKGIVGGERKWYVKRRDRQDIGQCFGSTPDEAVAKLWLELNKK